MNDPHLIRAFEGLADFFMRRETRPGVVARRLLGIARPTDDGLVDQLIRERRRRTRLDGSLDGSLFETSKGAWELQQLGCTRGHAGLGRMIGFLLGRQDQPGRFGEGCSDRRHEMAHCKHFLSGFFSPGSLDEPAAPLVLPTRTMIAAEFSARFAASCFALRTVLQAGEERRHPVRQHVEGLLLLAERWKTEGGKEFLTTLDVVFCAIGALGYAPVEFRQSTRAVAAHVVGMQAEDGAWEGTSLFHALDGLLCMRLDEVQPALTKATDRLLSIQQSSGGFDDEDDEEFALIALRTLRTRSALRQSPLIRRRFHTTAG